MARLYMFTFAVYLVLTVTALISCLSAYQGEVRGLPKIVWVMLILLLPIVGAAAYFAVGRPLPAGAARDAWRPGRGVPEAERSRQPAPDDDPNFLKALDSQFRRSDEELLRRWEEDLKRREDDLRKRGETPPSDG